MKIYCPKCLWEPREYDLWQCRPGCGHVWNTFDTGGVCLRCAKVWEITQCLQCHRVSQHEDWYHEDEPHKFNQDEAEMVHKLEK